MRRRFRDGCQAELQHLGNGGDGTAFDDHGRVLLGEQDHSAVKAGPTETHANGEPYVNGIVIGFMGEIARAVMRECGRDDSEAREGMAATRH